MFKDVLHMRRLLLQVWTQRGVCCLRFLSLMGTFVGLLMLPANHWTFLVVIAIVVTVVGVSSGRCDWFCSDRG